MSPPTARVTRFEDKSWTNWHASHVQAIDARFVVQNPEKSSSIPPSLELMRPTVAALQGLIGEALRSGRRLRALGNYWSFSEVAATDGWLVGTDTRWSVGPTRDQVVTDYRDRVDSLRFIQAGYSISALNKTLETRFERSLRTSGASNGQTFVGAMSTGTHGSAVLTGAIQSQTLSIHILPDPQRSLILEREDRPVLSASFAQELGAELVRDTDLFEAALVGLGSLGIVHGVLIETEPLFLLEVHQWWAPLTAELREAMTKLDFSGLRLPHPPYFFQVVINPYATDGKVCVKVMYRHPWPAGRRLDYSIDGKYGVGYDVPGVLARLVDAAPFLTDELVTALVQAQLKPISGATGSWGETFNYSDPRPATAGAALAVAAGDTLRALQIAQSALASFGFAPVIFACRYVQKTDGYLSFTRFQPTCVLDIDGVNSDRAVRLMALVRARFDQENLPYAQHWGKMHGLTPQRVRAHYGADLDHWIAARRRLLPDPALRHAFSNPLLDSLGMSA